MRAIHLQQISQTLKHFQTTFLIFFDDFNAFYDNDYGRLLTASLWFQFWMISRHEIRSTCGIQQQRLIYGLSVVRLLKSLNQSWMSYFAQVQRLTLQTLAMRSTEVSSSISQTAPKNTQTISDIQFKPVSWSHVVQMVANLIHELWNKYRVTPNLISIEQTFQFEENHHSMYLKWRYLHYKRFHLTLKDQFLTC